MLLLHSWLKLLASIILNIISFDQPIPRFCRIQPKVIWSKTYFSYKIDQFSFYKMWKLQIESVKRYGSQKIHIVKEMTYVKDVKATCYTSYKIYVSEWQDLWATGYESSMICDLCHRWALQYVSSTICKWQDMWVLQYATSAICEILNMWSTWYVSSAICELSDMWAVRYVSNALSKLCFMWGTRYVIYVICELSGM